MGDRDEPLRHAAALTRIAGEGNYAPVSPETTWLGHHLLRGSVEWDGCVTS